MNYPLSEKYSKEFILKNIMGPNPMKLLEELFERERPIEGSVVLDLGCGRGVTSIFMAKEYGLRVFATDLWVSATENKQRFDAVGLTIDQIIPIHAESHDLPYADEFFDAVVSVDAYHYFGLDKEYLGEHLLPLVKHGGKLYLIVPGMKKDLHANLPPEMLVTWSAEDLDTIHDAAHWRGVLEQTDGVEIEEIYELEGNDECWRDWLASDNPYAVSDRKPMEAGAMKYMNMLAIILRRK